jgi:hypothetical protein
MEIGTYRKKPVKWSDYTIDVFTPHLYLNSISGCGGNSLALLTGKNPDQIKNPNKKNSNDWTDTFMVTYLKQNGFKVIPLTKREVTNFDFSYGSGIKSEHVILMSQLFNKKTASWAVVHNDLWYHNFQTCSFTSLSLINSPTLTCYVLWHKKWMNSI